MFNFSVQLLSGQQHSVGLPFDTFPPFGLKVYFFKILIDIGANEFNV